MTRSLWSGQRHVYRGWSACVAPRPHQRSRPRSRQRPLLSPRPPPGPCERPPTTPSTPRAEAKSASQHSRLRRTLHLISLYECFHPPNSCNKSYYLLLYFRVSIDGFIIHRQQPTRELRTKICVDVLDWLNKSSFLQRYTFLTVIV